MQYSNQAPFNLSFSKNSVLIRLIYINLLVFIGTLLIHLPFWLMRSSIDPVEFVNNWFSAPSDLGELLIKPWTLISYMFVHRSIGHILGNMLMLFFLGNLFVQYLGERKLWTLYITGGIAGGLLYILFYNIFPVFNNVSAQNIGASAAVMAIVIAISTYKPNLEIRPFGLFSLPLKYLAAFLFIIDLISISNSNSGGHIAHIGGALLGYFFTKQWMKGKDITAWVARSTEFIVAVFKPSNKSKMKVKHRRPVDKYEYNGRKNSDQEQIDAILDKISRSGYDSLSKKEKEMLFNASKK